MIMLVAYQDALACPAHAMLGIVFFQSLQARQNRRVLLWLAIFGAKGVVAEWVQADGLGLVGVEVLGKDGPVGRLSVGRKYEANGTYWYELCDACCVIVDIVVRECDGGCACAGQASGLGATKWSRQWDRDLASRIHVGAHGSLHSH